MKEEIINGSERWKEYDENGNMIHYKNSNGFEEWYEYDVNGNMIHYKNSNGFEYWKSMIKIIMRFIIKIQMDLSTGKNMMLMVK